MNEKQDTNQRILDAALKEFSTYGFSGARMDRIAKAAAINKAMIFYYFSSKENLYELVIRRVFSKIYPQMTELISTGPSAQIFLENAVDIYVEIFSGNPDFVKMMVMELIQNPSNLTSFIREIFIEKAGGPVPAGPMQLRQLVEKWHEEGSISEEDPFQFLLNIISLSLLSFIGKPFLEGIFQVEVPMEEFKEKRVKSVMNLLKRGMLT